MVSNKLYNMKTTEIIGEGLFRQCYATPNPDLCVKRMKSSIDKQYFGFNFNIDMKRYLKFKFGISNMNKFEFNQITKLPETLKAYIPSKVELTELGLIMERQKDYNGEYSKNMIEFGKVRNEYFWNCVDEICSVFDESNLWYQDIFFKGNNVLVKKVSKDKFVPIMIDLKEIGKNLSPVQFHLMLKSEQKKKFYRRFGRFKIEYYQKNN
jgi:hypothetical protein